MENPSLITISNSQESSKGGLGVRGSRRPLQSRSINLTGSGFGIKQTTKPHSNSLMKSNNTTTENCLLTQENISQCQSLKESRTPSLDTESCDDQSIFRERADFSETNDMMLLKRANPVCDSDDEESLSSPTKRQRTGATTVLDWRDDLSEDESEGFSLQSVFRAA